MYKVKYCTICNSEYVPASSFSKYCGKCLTKNCLWCNTDFKAKDIKTLFCSLDCRSKYRFANSSKIVSCCHCGKEVKKTNSKLSYTKGIVFCGRQCREKYKWNNPDVKQQRVDKLKNAPACKSEQRKQQLNEARKNRKFGQETRDKIRAARMKQSFPTKMTSIEQALHEAFTNIGLVFSMHYTLFGKWQPDFVFEKHKIAIQADGDYWHSRPEAIKRDKEFNETAINNGWHVLRFSETRIKKELHNCVEECIDLLSKHG